MNIKQHTGGAYNHVVTPGIASFVGAGTFHCVDGNHSGVMAGKLNHLTGCLSAIGAGYANHIGSGGDCSFIGGGKTNCITGAYSAILGGSGNSDSGYAHTGIFGCNITASCRSTMFWVNELVAPSMPPGCTIGGLPAPPTGYPAGSLWYHIDANGNCPVYIL